jgi:two-component system response regulator YesN
MTSEIDDLDIALVAGITAPDSASEVVPVPESDLVDDSQNTIGSRLVTLHRAALADFLRSGRMSDFDDMFQRYMGSTMGSVLDDQALQNPLVENYVRTDMALTIAKFVIQLGANPDQLFDELGRSALSHTPATMETLRGQLRDACIWALDLRDHRAINRNAAFVQRALTFMAQRYGDPTLSLGKVAAEVGLSPNHFSAVFSAETGETFRDHLSELRIGRARELLRSTSMSNAEICDAVGYSDPHYFGAVFKRMMGQTPQQYRSQSVAQPSAEHAPALGASQP